MTFFSDPFADHLDDILDDNLKKLQQSIAKSGHCCNLPKDAPQESRRDNLVSLTVVI